MKRIASSLHHHNPLSCLSVLSLQHISRHDMKCIKQSSTVINNAINRRHFSCNSHDHNHHHNHNHNHHSASTGTGNCCQGEGNNGVPKKKCCQETHDHSHNHNHDNDNDHSCCSSKDADAACDSTTSSTTATTTTPPAAAVDNATIPNPNIPEECWHCGKFRKDQELFCTEPTCGRVQPIQTKKLNLFDVFEIPQSYFIQEKQLDNAFKELQKKLHPDKFATKSIDEKNVSTSSSSSINFAYQTLKDPVERAQYLIWLSFEKQIFDDSKTIQDPAFMMEVFELREEIQENINNPERKSKLIKYIQVSINNAEKEFEAAIQGNNSEEAIQNATRLKYYYKMLEELLQ